MSIHYEDHGVTLHHGDCLEVLPEIPDGSIDSVVTDPPYGLGFMGKAWDGLPPGQEWAEECLRALKPGGHLLAFGGTRTWHRLAVAIEDAGFEIRDSIAWMYGSGFPKSLDVSKAIEKNERGDLVRAKLVHFATTRGVDGKWLEAHGVASASSFADWTIGGHVPSDRNWRLMRDALEVTPAEESAFEREVISEGTSRIDDGTVYGLGHSGRRLGGAVTDEARHWQGWGTALKPAFEPIVVARKPLQGTVAANVLEHGTGALNIDGCRIGTGGQLKWSQPRDMGYHGGTDSGSVAATENPSGRWPANVILDESQAEALDEQTGFSKGSKPSETVDYGARIDTGGNKVLGRGLSSSTPNRPPIGDSGGASRFFYTAKADQSERITHNGTAHPTVKPLDLMRWLVRLVTQPGGTILEPFAGSGTTIEAALLEGFQIIGIEREADYLPLIIQRIQRRRDPIKYLAAAGDELGLFADDPGGPSDADPA